MQRLDVLIYAHDGRGLGHVSRSAAVGLALKRLHPGLSVLLATGCAKTGDLIGPGALDWVKLPAYATKVENGTSKGLPGPSGLDDAHLGEARAEMLKHLCSLLRPRVVLADHSPQGKHRELVPSLEASDGSTAFVLGVRAVVGKVDKIFSPLAADIFGKYYKELIWYGDAKALGDEAPEALAAHFGVQPMRAGYVSRLGEWQQIAPGLEDGPPLGLVAQIPWSDARTPDLMRSLARAARQLGPGRGPWRVFTDADPSALGVDVPGFVGLRPVGRDYFSALLRAGAVLVFGGHNSVAEAMGARKPMVAVGRGMADAEQEAHLARLCKDSAYPLFVLGPDHSPEEMAVALEMALCSGAAKDPGLDFGGAEAAAHRLAALAEGAA